MDIVFLHGGAQNGSIWDETIAAMTLQEPGAHRCIVLDAPGCGSKRGMDTSAMSHEALVDALVADVRAAGASGAMLVGHSQAGTALPAMIAQAPDLFAKVVYVSCVAPVPGGDMMETVLAIHAAPEAPLHGIFGNPDVPPMEQFSAMFCNDMGPQQAKAFMARLVEEGYPESASTWDGWQYDHLTAIPSTYVLCLRDQILTPTAQEAFAVRFHCDTIVRIDAGHQVQNTRPHALAEVLRLEAQPAS
ncbi:MAG TPA: alpha/beta hydrolase [Novosphingobium sp.]|nr:alpha/beta hydrolase [Novosphingobium sp.]